MALSKLFSYFSDTLRFSSNNTSGLIPLATNGSLLLFQEGQKGNFFGRSWSLESCTPIIFFISSIAAGILLFNAKNRYDKALSDTQKKYRETNKSLLKKAVHLQAILEGYSEAYANGIGTPYTTGISKAQNGAEQGKAGLEAGALAQLFPKDFRLNAHGYHTLCSYIHSKLKEKGISPEPGKTWDTSILDAALPQIFAKVIELPIATNDEERQKQTQEVLDHLKNIKEKAHGNLKNRLGALLGNPTAGDGDTPEGTTSAEAPNNAGVTEGGLNEEDRRAVLSILRSIPSQAGPKAKPPAAPPTRSVPPAEDSTGDPENGELLLQQELAPPLQIKSVAARMTEAILSLVHSTEFRETSLLPTFATSENLNAVGTKQLQGMEKDREYGLARFAEQHCGPSETASKDLQKTKNRLLDAHADWILTTTQAYEKLQKEIKKASMVAAFGLIATLFTRYTLGQGSQGQ